LAELTAFDRMATDARLAPDLRRRAMLSEMAGSEIAGHRRSSGVSGSWAPNPEAAMAPFGAALTD